MEADSLSSEFETTSSSNEEQGPMEETVAASREEEVGEAEDHGEGLQEDDNNAQRDATEGGEPVQVEKEDRDGSNVDIRVPPMKEYGDDSPSSPVAIAGTTTATVDTAGSPLPFASVSVPSVISSAPTKPHVVRRKPRTSKTGRKKKPIDMPRRPLSGYNYFFREERARWLAESEQRNSHKDEAGGLFSAMGKTIAQRWKEITPEDAERYKELAAKDMERYRREMDEYQTATARMKRMEAADKGDSDGGNPARGDRMSGSKASSSKSKAPRASASCLQSAPGMGLILPGVGGEVGGHKEAFEFADGSGGYYRETDLLRMNMNQIGVMSGGMGMARGGMGMVDPAFMGAGAGGGSFSPAATVMYPAGAAARLNPAFWGATMATGMGGAASPAAIGTASFGNPYFDPNTMTAPASADALNGYQGGFNPTSFRAQVFNSVNPGAYGPAGSASTFPGIAGSGVSLGAAPPVQFLAAQPQQPIFSVMGGGGAGSFGVYGPGDMVQMGPDASIGGAVGVGGGGVIFGGEDQMMMIQHMIQQQHPQQQPQPQEESAGDSFM